MKNRIYKVLNIKILKSWLIMIIFLLPCLMQAQSDNYYLTKYRLFHVERSKNKNLVCYDLNVDASGNWNLENPVVVYWINREEHMGERNDLSAIQKRLAYGYKTISHNQTSATIAINACSDRYIKITKQGNTYRCLVQINNQEAELKKIYVKTQTPNSLTVEYVELQGVNDKGEKVTERIKE